MNLPDDGLEMLERLLGPELSALLDEFEALGRDIDALPADGGTSTRRSRAELEERRQRLRADTLDELLATRRRLEHGAPACRDERTMPLPFVDLGGH